MAIDVLNATDGTWRLEHRKRYRFGCADHPVRPVYRDVCGNVLKSVPGEESAKKLMAQALALCGWKEE